MKATALLPRIARERRAAVLTVTQDHRMITDFDTVHPLDDGRLRRQTQASAPA